MPIDNDPAPGLEARLRREIRGEIMFDAFSRGRYSTDASIYQIEPLGVVVPENREDAAAAIAIARDEGVPVLPRGAGTSQCGQTVARALVLDCSKHMDRMVSVDVEARRARVEPGVVLDRLNRSLRQHRLFFPVDPSTASRATIGGMTANNSCGSRSLRYGNMVHNVRGVDALLADGTTRVVWRRPGQFRRMASRWRAHPARYRDLVRQMRALHRREADEIDARFPKVLRRVGGYNIDSIDGMATGATTWRDCSSAPKEPSPSSTKSSSICSPSRRTGCLGFAIFLPFTVRWMRPDGLSSWVPAQSNWSIAR